MGMNDYIQVGQTVLYGKFKNRPALVKKIFKDDRGVIMIELEPVPKGRKKNRIMSLFSVWKLPEDRAMDQAVKVAGLYAGKCSLVPEEEDPLAGRLRTRAPKRESIAKRSHPVRSAPSCTGGVSFSGVAGTCTDAEGEGEGRVVLGRYSPILCPRGLQIMSAWAVDERARKNRKKRSLRMGSCWTTPLGATRQFQGDRPLGWEV